MSSQAVPVERLGRYEILGEIASGGMATVFLARMSGAKGFQRLVAIKRLHPHLESEEDFVSMFLDEARLAARIHHSNCVATLEVEDENGLYIVMEYIEGDRLLALLRHAARTGEHTPLPVTLRVAMDTLAGLHAAHELTDDEGELLGLVHRDVSPQNILIGSDGVCRLTDFGIAKATARLTVTRDGQLKGKIAYMAPEQTKRVEIDRRVDLFAMGIIVWELLTSRKLFNGESDVEVLNQLLFEPIPHPREIVPTLPAELNDAVMKALERDPTKRFATAAEFGDALEDAAKLFGGAANARTVANHLVKVSGEKLARDRARATATTDGGSPSRVQRRPTGTHEVLASSIPRTPVASSLPLPPPTPGSASGRARGPAIPSLPSSHAAPPPPLSTAASVALVDDDEEIPTQAIVRSSLVGLSELKEVGKLSYAAKEETPAPAPSPSPNESTSGVMRPDAPLAPTRQPTAKLPVILGPLPVPQGASEAKHLLAVGPPPLVGDSHLTAAVTVEATKARTQGSSKAPLFVGLSLLMVLGVGGGWYVVRANQGATQNTARNGVTTVVVPQPAAPAIAPVASVAPAAPVVAVAPPPAPAAPAAPPAEPPANALVPALPPAVTPPPGAPATEQGAGGAATNVAVVAAPPERNPGRGGRRGGAAPPPPPAARAGAAPAAPPPPAVRPPPSGRDENPFGNDNPYNH